MLDELILGGEVQETSKKNVLKAIAAQDLLQEVINGMSLYSSILIDNLGKHVRSMLLPGGDSPGPVRGRRAGLETRAQDLPLPYLFQEFIVMARF